MNALKLEEFADLVLHHRRIIQNVSKNDVNLISRGKRIDTDYRERARVKELDLVSIESECSYPFSV